MTGSDNPKSVSKPHVPVNVLITGACGFIGSNFVNFIFEKWPQAKFVNLDKMAPGASEKRVLEKHRNSGRYQMVEANLMEAPVIRRVLTENRIDTIIHFAALTHVDESYADPIGYMQENLMAMTVLLEAVKEYGRLKRFVHISTDEVYGDCADAVKPKDECCQMDPTNPYSASKAACELLLRSYQHSYKIPNVIVRMNNVYGPRQYHTKLIPKFVKLALEGKAFTLAGDGSPKRSWMFVDDCAEAIRRITEFAQLGQVYNIGTDFELSNIELAKQIHETVNRLIRNGDSSAEVKFAHIPDRPHNDGRYWIDFTKMRRELGWQCRVPFGDGLDKTVAYYIEHWGSGERLAKNGVPDMVAGINGKQLKRCRDGDEEQTLEEEMDDGGGRSVKVSA